MSDQGELFGRRRRYPETPGHRRVSTSVVAAASIEPHVTRLQQRIIDYLATRIGGATYTEIMAACDLGAPTVSGRMREMKLWRENNRHSPLVRDSGVRRPTPSGRMAQVYVLTTLGFERATKQRSAS
jgi:hypothetical protein